MAQEEFRYSCNDQERTILLLNPPENMTDRRYAKFMRDVERIQYFSIGHGFEQTKESWKASFEPEEYVCVLRYLNKFSWIR